MGGNGGGGSSSRRTLGNLSSLEQKAKQALSSERRNVFISFAFEDIDHVTLLRGQAKNENNDLEFIDRSLHEPYDSKNADYIRSKLTERINQTSVTVVYLTDDAAKSPWVQWEVKKSLELGKTVIATHAKDAAPKSVPQWVADNKIKVVPWSGLADKLKQF
jgi:antiphage defense system Thoeris ThsB-like protein